MLYGAWKVQSLYKGQLSPEVIWEEGREGDPILLLL